MNQYVAASELLITSFKIKTIGISYNNSVSQMGNCSFSKFFKIIKYKAKLIKELIQFKPDLVYFQISPLGFAYLRDSLFAFIMKLFSKKIVFHLHGKGISKQINSPFKKLLYKSVFKNQEVITLSKLLDYDIQDVFNGRIFHVPNGIPDVGIPHIVKNTNDFTVLFLSNLIRAKGIVDYLKALMLLKSKSIHFKGIIAGGEGDLSSEELSSLISKFGLKDYVCYLGPQYGQCKRILLAKSDVLVFPTKNETFGLVNLEAMQFSIPVISTNVGAIPEIVVDGETGYVVEKNSPNQIAEKILFLLNNPNVRKKMGEAGRKKYLEKYTIERFEEDMRDVFNSILKCAE